MPAIRAAEIVGPAIYTVAGLAAQTFAAHLTLHHRLAVMIMLACYAVAGRWARNITLTDTPAAQVWQLVGVLLAMTVANDVTQQIEAHMAVAFFRADVYMIMVPSMILICMIAVDMIFAQNNPSATSALIAGKLVTGTLVALALYFSDRLVALTLTPTQRMLNGRAIILAVASYAVAHSQCWMSETIASRAAVIQLQYSLLVQSSTYTLARMASMVYTSVQSTRSTRSDAWVWMAAIGIACVVASQLRDEVNRALASNILITASILAANATLGTHAARAPIVIAAALVVWLAERYARTLLDRVTSSARVQARLRAYKAWALLVLDIIDAIATTLLIQSALQIMQDAAVASSQLAQTLTTVALIVAVGCALAWS